MDTVLTEPGHLAEWVHTYKRQASEVQGLMQLALECPEFPDLLFTIRKAIQAAEAELEGPRDTCSCENGEGGFRVVCEPLPMDLASFSPAKVAQHITAIQQRAAVLGTGPPEWVVSAKCQARAGPNEKWGRAVIEGISPSGRFLVEGIPSARESCHEVESTDLMLVPPIAGAFWAPRKLPPYDTTLPAYPVVYSEEEKAAQRGAYQTHFRGLKDAIAAGKTEYTFPPGVYRSKEKIYMEGTNGFTLTMANVEWVCEADGFMSLRCNTDLTVRGPLALDAEPFNYSQCQVTGTDRETYLELQIMPGYAEPNADGKFMIYDAQGRLFPTGQVWPKACNAIGDGRFRIEFDDNNRHVMSIPGIAKAGNYVVMRGGPGGIQLSVDTNVTFEHIRAYCGGAIWGFHYGEARFTDLRGLRRPGTNRLFAGGTCYQVWNEGGSFLMDRCEVAYNDDDLSDIFCWLGYTAENAGADTTIFALAGSGQSWAAGQELRIYDCRSVELVGNANIKEVVESKDEAALAGLNAAFKAAGMREQQIWDLKRVELNKPVKIARLCIIENANAKPKRIAVTNCHFHDGLNCGIDCKGAHEILIANNVVERTRVSGIAAAEDHWWGEGGMGGDVMIRNNTVHDAYYQHEREGPSITAYASGIDAVPSGCPIKSVRAVGNLAVNPKGKPISVMQCADVVICGNLPADPLPSDAPDDATTA